MKEEIAQYVDAHLSQLLPYGWTIDGDEIEDVIDPPISVLAELLYQQVSKAIEIVRLGLRFEITGYEAHDASGYVEQVDVNDDDPLPQTLGDIYDWYTGQWEPTFLSGLGRRWLTYGDAATTEIKDMLYDHVTEAGMAHDGIHDPDFHEDVHEAVNELAYEIEKVFGKYRLDLD